MLFLVDVGVRRIQLDRDEWRRATQALRRKFLPGVPRTPEAEESLAALLARRGQVRSKQTAPTVEPSPDLFRPAKAVALPYEEAATASSIQPQPPIIAPEKTVTEPEATTTSRLLEAKRRAQKRK